MNPKKLQAIVSLAGPERYSHFIKTAADERRVWVLDSDGWALYVTDTGDSVLPLWPAAEYARLCAVEDWQDYEPEEIDLDELLDELLPDLAVKGHRVAIFPTAQSQGVLPEFSLLQADLRRELSRIED